MSGELERQQREIERQQRMLDNHDTRLQQHDLRLDELDVAREQGETEDRRTRKRLHDLESDRHALSLATGAVTVLATKVGSMVDNMAGIAEEAAERALAKERATRRNEFRKSWQFRFAALAAAGAIILAVVAVVGLFTGHVG